jgi:hypothetical protein
MGAICYDIFIEDIEMSVLKITKHLLAAPLLMGFYGLSHAESVVPTSSFFFDFFTASSFTVSVSGDVSMGETENELNFSTDFYGLSFGGPGAASLSASASFTLLSDVFSGTVELWQETGNGPGLDVFSDTMLASASGAPATLTFEDLDEGIDYFITIGSPDPVGYSGKLELTQSPGQIGIIPLPGAALLFGSALLSVGGLGRKKKPA